MAIVVTLMMNIMAAVAVGDWEIVLVAEMKMNWVMCLLLLMPLLPQRQQQLILG